MASITPGVWVPTGNDYLIDGLWGRLGVQENFGETYVSGATSGLAVKDAGDQVFLYAGAVNGGVHLRVYDKATDSWGDRWQWISQPGSDYIGSQSIGSLSISEDGDYLAVGQSALSNGNEVAAQSQGIQIGAINDDGSIEWLPVADAALAELRGKNIRSLAWVDHELVATSSDSLIRATATSEGITTAQAEDQVFNDEPGQLGQLGKSRDFLVLTNNFSLEGNIIKNKISISDDSLAFADLTGAKYESFVGELESKGNAIVRTAVHEQLVNGELIAFVGAAKFQGDWNSAWISAIARLRIDPNLKELIDYSILEVDKGQIGTNQAERNFAFALDPNDQSANSILAGGNHYLYSNLSAITVGGGLVRVDFINGADPVIADTLYGPKIDTENDKLITQFFPGQPHADSRTIVFYESATGPRLIQSDDGGIWEIQLQDSDDGSNRTPGAWWKSLTTKGLNTLEMNVATWNAVTNSIAAAYQDNAASLGYFGDDHATNFWVADGTIALFDDGANQNEYIGYLGAYNYIKDGYLQGQTYNGEGYIENSKKVDFFLQRNPGSVPIPWAWYEAEQQAQAKYSTEDIFAVPVESNAYQQGVALVGFANIYEQVNSPASTSKPSILFRPLLASGIQSSFFFGTALDYQGTTGTYLNQSLYVAGYMDGSSRPIVFGREANSDNDPASIYLKPIDILSNSQLAPVGDIVDIAHASTSAGDVLYWIQGGKSIAFQYYPTNPADQTLNIRYSNGKVETYHLTDFEGIIQDDDLYGYQTLTYVPANAVRTARLVLGGLNGPYYIELDDLGMPMNSNLEFIKMNWLNLPGDRSPGSYIRSMEYNPHDDLLFAATQGQGGFIYSFSGELGERSQSDELLHVSDITLAQRIKADLNKRGAEENSRIVIQLNSELQSKLASTDIEIILHDAGRWRYAMEFVSPYDIQVSPSGNANQAALEYLNILQSTGLEYLGGREEGGDIIIPFSFPAGVSLYNLIVNQNEFASPQPISLGFSVRTVDGLSSKTSMLQLVPQSAGTRSSFYGSSFLLDNNDFYGSQYIAGFGDLIHELVPTGHVASSNDIFYTITPTTSAGTAQIPTTSSDHRIRSTLLIDSYDQLRLDDSLNSSPRDDAWLYSVIANFDAMEILFSAAEEEEKINEFLASYKKSAEILFYNPITGVGTRFYDLSGDGYADRLSISANASQDEYTTNVSIGFGSIILEPVFSAVGSSVVLLANHFNANDIPSVSFRISVDLDAQAASTSSLGYLLFDREESLVDLKQFLERSRMLMTSLGAWVDLSALPSQKFSTEILANHGQRLMFFEVEGGSIDQLTGLDDPRLSWFESTLVPDSGDKTLALINQNQTALTINITPGVQGINPLIADLQNLAPILDLTAFAKDQTITGTLAFGREAVLDSILGWYVISRADGAITAANGDTLLPGHASYIQEALRADNLVDPLTGIQAKNRETNSKDFSITGGMLLAPFAKVSDGETYFAFAEANSDRIEHFVSLGTNMIGFEDLKGGGDRDFQDLVQIFDFSIDLIA